MASVVEGSGEIGDTCPLDGIDSLGDDPILEHRLGEGDDVVHDNTSPSRLQRQNITSKSGLASECRGERQTRTGCHIVHQLEYGPAFVGAPAAVRQLLNHGHWRQVVTSHISGCAVQAIEAVGQYPDGDSSSV